MGPSRQICGVNHKYGRGRHIIGIENRPSMSMAGGFKLLGNIVTILDHAGWFNVQSGASPLWN